MKRMLQWFLLIGLVFSNSLPMYPADAGSSAATGTVLLGAAWYPEQWPESRWEQDLKLMEAAHIRFVRVGEFAWSTMEPAEGRYELDWLERAVNLAARHGMKVVIGTPTAAPPAWLTSKYPDTLRTEENGQRAKHGNRIHFSFASQRYREFCRRIAERMAERFGKNPAVIGWQIDNEYTLPTYDAEAQQQFQDWLKAKYKTLDSLNAHWTTAYWSQTYDNWAEIPIPVGWNNPSLLLEWKRFISDTWRSYQKNQIDAIRAHAAPEQFITTNYMGFYDGFDHYVVSRDLTLAAWDSYVGSGHLEPERGLTHDLTRGFKRKNFWIMETQPGAVNWAGVNNFLDRGEVRLMAWQAIGHGADAVGYWQWRSALGGQEQYHGTLVGADGTPVPMYGEVKRLGEELDKAGPVLSGTEPVSQVALLYSYDSHWAIQFQKHTNKYDDIGLLRSYYSSIRRLAQSVDVVEPTASLDQYKLVLAPNLNLIPEDLARHLADYVRNGGHLVLGPRSGMKDEFNALLPQRQPGYLRDSLGSMIEQYYALEKDVPVSGKWGNGTSSIWAEQIEPLSPDSETLLSYGTSNGWLDGRPAAVSRKLGKGTITYIGAILDDSTMAKAAEWLFRLSGATPAFEPVPDGVEVCKRSGSGKEVVVLLNHSGQPQQVNLSQPMKDLLTGTSSARVELPKFGVAVLTKP